MPLSNQAERNRTTVRRFIESVLNEGDLDAADELVDEGFLSHGWRGEDAGRRAVKDFAAWQRRESPDWLITIHDTVAEGDKVVVRATGRGTRQAADEIVSQGLVGQPVEIDWIAVYRLIGGRIAERWTVTSPARRAATGSRPGS
jgi:predicted SnoaL-like aldol condensation-catalyzing enzyme